MFGSFLILPAIFLLQDLIVGEKRGLWWRTLAFLTVVLLIFLSFSRGSWIAFVLAVFFLVMMTMMTDVKRQGRILLMFGIALIVLFGALAVALSIDPVREMFLQRAQFTQSYDEGARPVRQACGGDSEIAGKSQWPWPLALSDFLL